MSRFKALWVIDLSRSRRSIDLLTNVQTFLNRGRHETNISCVCLSSCPILQVLSICDFFLIRHICTCNKTLIEMLATEQMVQVNLPYFRKQEESSWNLNKIRFYIYLTKFN